MRREMGKEKPNTQKASIHAKIEIKNKMWQKPKGEMTISDEGSQGKVTEDKTPEVSLGR